MGKPGNKRDTRSAARDKVQPLKVRLSEIIETETPFEYSFDRKQLPELLADLNEEYRPGEGLAAGLRLTRTGDVVSIQGDLTVGLVYTCCRCLAEREWRRDLKVRWTCLPEAKYRADISPDEEVELTAEDLEVSFYQGDELNLGDMLRQMVLLELSPYPVCETECEAAGGMKAEEDEADAIDPRWLPLLDIKKSRN